MSSPAPGWNPDPSGRHEYRYWDGSNWTDDVSDNGVTSADPLAGAGGPGYPTDQTPPTQVDQTQADPTQAYGQGPAAPGYDPSGGYQSGGYPAAGAGGYAAGPGGPGQPGQPGGYDPYGTGGYGTGGGLPPATPEEGRARRPDHRPGGRRRGRHRGARRRAARGGDDDDDPVADDTTTTTEAEETTTTEEEETTTTEAEGPETQDVFALAVGDCVTDSSLEGEVSEVSIIDCGQPHTSEVYHSFQMTDSSLPDQTGIETIVQDQCLPSFESFVGVDYPSSALDVSYLAPTQDSWDAGDRELLCLIYDPAGDVTGSLAGANR